MPRRWGRVTDTKEIPNSNDAQSEAGAVTLKKTTDAGYPVVEIKALKHYKYYERGQHHDVQLSMGDPLPLPSIHAAASAYHLKIRALWLRRQGLSQDEAAVKLRCSARSLDQPWQATLSEIQRPPREIPKYIAAYEQRMLNSGLEPFREPILRRGYAKHLTEAYAECASALPWEQAVLRKRNYETGEVAITSIASSRQDCSFGGLQTGLPHIDKVLAKVKEDLNIQDPGAYLMCNWYQDGQTNIASHSHDFWSAILSFGAPRIFLLDGQPVLLGQGDLLVFGTQRHSVPKMPAVQEGRISVAIFWYPERTKADGTFTITLDPSLAEAALSSDVIAEAIAQAAAADISRIPLDTNGRGVGKREDQTFLDDDPVEEDFLSEDRLIEIALKVSMMEQ